MVPLPSQVKQHTYHEVVTPPEDDFDFPAWMESVAERREFLRLTDQGREVEKQEAKHREARFKARMQKRYAERQKAGADPNGVTADKAYQRTRNQLGLS